MAAKDLTSAEKEQLAEIVGQIKETKAYKNYQAGLSVNKRRLESSPGEGDAFAKAGEMIRSGKIPTWLHASAVGQTKVEKALQALLKEKKLHGLLKDGEFKEALYDELYVESGALNRFLINDGREAAAEAGQELADNPGPADDHTAAADSNTKPQEEKMSEEKKQAEVKDNVPVDGAAADNGNDQMVDLPDYYDEEKFKDLEIKIVNGKISKADNEKLEKRKKELEKGGNNDQQDSPKKGESKDGAAAAPDNKAKEGVEATASGLQYKVIRKGNGAVPTDSTQLAVRYKGKLIDGTVFDESKDKAFECTPSGFVIEGWKEALKLFPAGSKVEIYVPQNLGYGAANRGKIKPFSTLIFEMEISEKK